MNQPQKTLNEWLGAEDYLRDAAISRAKQPIVRQLRDVMNLTHSVLDMLNINSMGGYPTHMTLNADALYRGYDLVFTLETLELQSESEDNNTWSAQLTIASKSAEIKIHPVAHSSEQGFRLGVSQLHDAVIAAQRSAFARAIQSLVDLYFDCGTFHQPNISSLLFGLIPPLKGRGFPTMALWDDIIKELEKLYGEYRFTHCHHSPV